MAKILIVDDESNIRLMLKLALQASGHLTQSASDGPEALEKWDGGDFDLVLLDQRMPAMEGLEVLRAMKARRSDAKIIMVTAFGTVDLALAAARAGATDFLRKPFTTEVLRAAVAAALENRAHENRPISPSQTAPADLKNVAVNGFRLEAAQIAPTRATDGSLSHQFAISTPGAPDAHCEVILSPVFLELVKTHADRDVLDDQDRFWLWLCEEALANYLWQNAAPPPEKTLVLTELSSNLRRWIEAVAI